MNLKMIVLGRNLVETITGNALNLYINFGRIDSFIIESLHILKYGIFSHLLGFVCCVKILWFS